MTRDDLPKGPLDIVPLSWKEHNHVQYAYEKNFAARIWRFRNLPGYAFMHRWAQKQIDTHCGDSLDGISARVYMDTVLEQEGAELQTWAKKYIAQSLWTDYAKTPRDATGRIREEWTVWCGTQESPTAISFKAGTSKEEIRSWFKETFGLIPA
jgi:hypothetical protein